MDPPAATDHSSEAQNKDPDNKSSRRRESFASQDSQTASEFIDSQLKLEADAREILPYSFDICTQPLGPLRQTLFSCLTCNPPPEDPDEPYTAAGVCYSCSISCHGEHNLVELFSKRNFVCDCGTSRLPATSPCTLRTDPETGAKGVHSQKPAEGNKYNHNFRNRFCGCGEIYDPHKEKGTMFQCLGLGTAETGGCGEDWWHPECLIGLPRGWQKAAKDAAGKQEGENRTPEEEEEDEEESLPPGFPGEDDFETFICYKCLDSNPWLKRYANTPGFLPPVYKDGGLRGSKCAAEEKQEQPTESRKRKAEDDVEEEERDSKRAKGDESNENGNENKNENGKVKEEPAVSTPPKPKPKHESLPQEPPTETFSLFVKEDFREHLCHCPDCFPNLIPHPQLREEEETYEPPLSEDGGDAANGSQGTGSLLERGEAALSTMDRVKAIEGVMVYNHLRDKVKEFLKPFAESGKPVSAEDIKAYFEKLRGDDLAIKEASGRASAFGSRSDDNGGSGGGEGDNRREQSGY